MNIKEKGKKILLLEIQIKKLVNKCKKRKELTSKENLKTLIYVLQARMLYSEMQMVITQPTKGIK